VSVRSLTGLIDHISGERISHLLDLKVLLPSLEFSRCFEGAACLQIATRLQAIQLYPYHPDFKAQILLNGFAVCPFSDMLCFHTDFSFW